MSLLGEGLGDEGSKVGEPCLDKVGAVLLAPHFSLSLACITCFLTEIILTADTLLPAWWNGAWTGHFGSLVPSVSKPRIDRLLYLHGLTFFMRVLLIRHCSTLLGIEMVLLLPLLLLRLVVL